MSVLERILAAKRDQVAALARSPGAAALAREAARAPAPRGFRAALESGAPPRVIAEFKRASPSKGEIRPDADPCAIARAYAGAGACALSVLTDTKFFGGSLDDLRAVRAAIDLPLLRKDFTIDPIQVLEARAAGADAVLLIVAALDDALLRDLLDAAHDLALDALVEVHTRPELDRALGVGTALLGINNRDLATFVTDVENTRRLLPWAGRCTVVSESGLDDPATLSELAERGVHAFLVGEALMRAPDPGAALVKLRGAP